MPQWFQTARVKLLSGGSPRSPRAMATDRCRDFVEAMPDWKGVVGRRIDDLVNEVVPGSAKGRAVELSVLRGRGQRLVPDISLLHQIREGQHWLNGDRLDPPPPVTSRTNAFARCTSPRRTTSTTTGCGLDPSGRSATRRRDLLEPSCPRAKLHPGPSLVIAPVPRCGRNCSGSAAKSFLRVFGTTSCPRSGASKTLHVGEGGPVKSLVASATISLRCRS